MAQTKPRIGGFYRLQAAPAALRDKVGKCVEVHSFGTQWRVMLDFGPAFGRQEAYSAELVSVDAAYGASSAPSSPAAQVAADDPSDRSEAAEARRFIAEIERLAERWPEATEVYHVDNGGKASAVSGWRKKQEGVAPGVLDYALDVPRFDANAGRFYCGWRGELKRASGGTLSDAQQERITLLNRRGYWAEAHFGHEAMLRDLTRYLLLSLLTDFSVVLKLESDKVESCR